MRGVACGGRDDRERGKAVVVFFSVERLIKQIYLWWATFFLFGVNETTTDREARLGVSDIRQRRVNQKARQIKEMSMLLHTDCRE